MAIVKITKSIKEIEGNVFETLAKPFGDGSHVVLPKKYRGKYVHIITPIKPRYSWILSETEKDEVLLVCEKVLKRDSKKLRKYKMDKIQEIRNTKFEADVLIQVMEMLKESPKHAHLIKKIESKYDISV